MLSTVRNRLTHPIVYTTHVGSVNSFSPHLNICNSVVFVLFPNANANVSSFLYPEIKIDMVRIIVPM